MLQFSGGIHALADKCRSCRIGRLASSTPGIGADGEQSGPMRAVPGNILAPVVLRDTILRSKFDYPGSIVQACSQVYSPSATLRISGGPDGMLGVRSGRSHPGQTFAEGVQGFDGGTRDEVSEAADQERQDDGDENQ